MTATRRVLLLVGIGTCGLVIFGLLKQPPAPPPPSAFWNEPIPSQSIRSNSVFGKAIQDARSSLLERMQYFGTPGLSVTVTYNGEIIWMECFGYSDIEHKTLVEPDTKFRIGSVSKSLTAAAAARLFEQQKLDWDAPATNYLPEFPRKNYSFSVRHLAGHLAGIGRNEKQDFVNTRQYRSVAEALRDFQYLPLVFPPGSKFRYSGEGYTVLSAIIESVHQRDFLTAMRELVFEPLQMEHTCADNQSATNVTLFYDNYSSKSRMPEIATFHDHSRSWAAGGFLSTPLDLARFGNAHLKEGFLKEATLLMLHTSQRTTDGKETGYGLGWSLANGGSGVRQVRHFGDTVGGQAFLVLCPDLSLVIALVCTGNFWNYYGDGSSGATDRLVEIFAEELGRVGSSDTEV